MTHAESRRAVFAVTLTVLAALACGCSDSFDRPAPKAEVGAVEASAQRAGDPQAGFEYIVSGEYMTCGMPFNAARRVLGAARGEVLLPGRAGRNADLPYFMSVTQDEQGTEIVTNNCLFCHAAVLDGELVIGLGNESRDCSGER